MFGQFARKAPEAPEPVMPVLDLSGPRLSEALDALIKSAESDGGVERYIDALKLKSSLFVETFGGEAWKQVSEESFNLACAFIAPARRRVGEEMAENGMANVRLGLGALLDGVEDTASTDQRMATIRAVFPQDKQFRWVRDLAAEILHFTHPELYPLMTRWIWDVNTNSGVLREIWFSDDLDNLVIDVDDNYDAFIMLRQELSQYLSDNGVFKDVPFYVDLLCAQVYGDYISARGATYLRTDFSTPEDPMEYCRHMLGLDGVDTRTGRTKLKKADGTPHRVADATIASEA
jgi:hypothetical protein